MAWLAGVAAEAGPAGTGIVAVFERAVKYVVWKVWEDGEPVEWPW